MEEFVPKDISYMANLVISNPGEMASITYGLTSYTMLITIGAVLLVYSLDADLNGGRFAKLFSKTNRVNYAVGLCVD